MISAHPGLVPRIDGCHSRDRIHCGTVFYDNVSTLSFTYLQYSTGGIEIIAAKQSYENFAGSFGVMVKVYHANNGIFAEKGFRDEVDAPNQIITYCAVGDHRQNGLVEYHIGALTRGSRCILLHAKRRWLTVITTLLWRLTWRYYDRRINDLHIALAGKSPLDRFSDVD